MTNAPSGAARQKAGSAKPGSTKPGPTPTVSNHYVPRWYQRRFLLPGDTRLRYLDLRPERIPAAPGRKFRSNLMHWGPERCFARDHLYTIKLGRWMTDEIEHGFFRQIDEGGKGHSERRNEGISRQYIDSRGRPRNPHGIIDHGKTLFPPLQKQGRRAGSVPGR